MVSPSGQIRRAQRRASSHAPEHPPEPPAQGGPTLDTTAAQGGPAFWRIDNEEFSD